MTAETLYEAAALGLAAFQRSNLISVVAGSATTLEIVPRTPAVRHGVAVRKVLDWLESTSRSPRERLLKENLKTLLARETA